MVEMQTYDVAVVGLGAMGSAALYAAARRGLRVIGFDRLEPGHNRSSSFGESRVIRLAYFEHPSYVPLLRGAYRAWRDLEVATGERVLTITGIVEAGHPGAALVEGSVRSAREHDLPHELLSPRQVSDRFPAFNLPADWDCVVQPDGGVLLPEKAIGLFVAAALIAALAFAVMFFAATLINSALTTYKTTTWQQIALFDIAGTIHGIADPDEQRRIYERIPAHLRGYGSLANLLQT